jgi:hypothetical protein
VNPERVLTDVEQARAAGIPWEDLILTRPIGPTDPGQLRTARKYVQFRSGLDPEEDQRTVERGSRILRADADAGLLEQVLGLAPGETDFGDVTRALDEQASKIHRPGDFRAVSGGGKHEDGQQPL